MEDKTKNKITDEELSRRTSDAIDEVATSVKSAAKKMFDAFVERTADVFCEVFDIYTKKAKHKIKGEKNEEKK